MSTGPEGGGITREDRQAMVSGMIALHSEIQTEIEKDEVEPARLMRLQGAALNQCLIALAALLLPEGLPLPDESE
jgi:hypothetical protein